jgi:hypothetical protein
MCHKNKSNLAGYQKGAAIINYWLSKYLSICWKFFVVKGNGGKYTKDRKKLSLNDKIGGWGTYKKFTKPNSESKFLQEKKKKPSLLN